MLTRKLSVTWPRTWIVMITAATCSRGSRMVGQHERIRVAAQRQRAGGHRSCGNKRSRGMTVPVGYAYDTSHRTDRQYPAPAGADRRHARSGRGTAWIGRPRDPVRRRRARHPAAFRGDRFAGRDRRRAAQAELRDVSGRRTHEPRAGRRDDSVRGRPHPPAPAPHVRPVPLRDARPGRTSTARDPTRRRSSSRRSSPPRR